AVSAVKRGYDTATRVPPPDQRIWPDYAQDKLYNPKLVPIVPLDHTPGQGAPVNPGLTRQQAIEFRQSHGLPTADQQAVSYQPPEQTVVTKSRATESRAQPPATIRVGGAASASRAPVSVPGEPVRAVPPIQQAALPGVAAGATEAPVPQVRALSDVGDQ